MLRIEFDTAPDAGVQGEAAASSLTNGAGAAHVRELAAGLAQQVRSFYFVGRHGEKGLMVVLPQTPRSGAMELAERIRVAVESTAFAPAAAGQVTATIGLACFPQEGLEVEALVAVAQRALDQGRRKGGNCVSTVALRAA